MITETFTNGFVYQGRWFEIFVIVIILGILLAIPFSIKYFKKKNKEKWTQLKKVS